MPYGWKVTEVDGTTFGGYQWPDKGWVRATNVVRSNTGPCPRQETYGVPSGDGLCVAKTWAGAASGGIRAHRGLIVWYDEGDVLGGNSVKVRVARVYVLGVVDIHRLARSGEFAGADLWRANLSGANLSGAGLIGASLPAGWALSVDGLVVRS